MGMVYEAEQTAPVQRRVALKVMRADLDSREVVARFETERQALAVMSHESIAKVLDAGASDTGRPFFVMELVPGVPITDYCDRRTHSTRDRVALFIRVCEAVQHAHQKGVIHRDLKPTNVLVEEAGGKPLPKVIDFGIAKAAGLQRLSERTHVTQYGEVVGTPAYMSPEQAEMSGLDVDTRTDIYSLGVMLYRMLCNRLPFRARAQPELVRQIREDDPQPPRQLVPNLPMELERICLKAMAKAAGDRYTTAGDMAQEIRDLLQGNVAARRHERPAEAPRASAPAARVQRRHLSFLAVDWEAVAPDEEADVDDLAEMSAAFKRRCIEIVTRYSGTTLRADGHTLVACFG
jgi:serine/threonine protein kinase